VEPDAQPECIYILSMGSAISREATEETTLMECTIGEEVSGSEMPKMWKRNNTHEYGG
jgi:hypothetical protein